MSRAASSFAPWVIAATVSSLVVPRALSPSTQDESAQPPQARAEGKDAPDRRNPRQIQRDEGRGEGPRLAAGGVSLRGDDLEHYRKLEPLIGEFTITGKNWRRPDADPFDTEGTWTNSWDMGGWYLRCEFEINTGRPYRVLGLMCYDVQDNEWEGDFYTSAGTNRSRRNGAFDEAGRVLTLMSRNSSQSENDPPQQKVVIEILGDHSFTYTGWVLNRETDEWWRNYEIVATRIEAATGGDPATASSGAAGADHAAQDKADDADSDEADADDDGDDHGRR